MAKDIPDKDDLAMIRMLEEQLHDPDVRRSAQLTGVLLADDFVEFGSSGRVYHRADMIEALASETREPAEAMLSWDYRLTRLSQDVALLTYKTKAGARHSLRSSIWRHADGRWQLVFHQGTRVP